MIHVLALRIATRISHAVTIAVKTFSASGFSGAVVLMQKLPSLRQCQPQQMS
jgi:hypothetical protein